MAIQLIDTATPQVGLKGGAEKINANFTDSENAASRLVQSSPTETTDGALMAVGAFGLGISGQGLITNDLFSLTTTGFYNYANTAANIPSAKNGLVRCEIRNDYTASIRGYLDAVDQDGARFQSANINGTWSDWQRIDPQAFGLGVSTLTSEAFTGDCNTLLVSGNYFIEAAATNKPIAGIGTLSVEVVNATNTVQRFTGVTFGDVYVRTQNGGTWSDWVELWTEYSYQPQTIGGGLNVPQMMKIISGTTWLSGDTKSGSVLNYAFGNSSGVMQGIGTPSGTWLNIGNRDTLVGQYVLAVRIA